MLLVGRTLEVAADLGVLDVVFLWDRVARIGILGDGERLHLQFFMSAFQRGEGRGRREDEPGRAHRLTSCGSVAPRSSYRCGCRSGWSGRRWARSSAIGGRLSCEA